jgi:Fe-S cluster assembly scaffold protein SufB
MEQQMENLMAKGLDEDEAVGYDIIVRGILR